MHISCWQDLRHIHNTNRYPGPTGSKHTHTSCSSNSGSGTHAAARTETRARAPGLPKTPRASPSPPRSRSSGPRPRPPLQPPLPCPADGRQPPPASPRGSTFQAMVSVMAVKIQLSSPRGVRRSLSRPGILGNTGQSQPQTREQREGRRGDGPGDRNVRWGPRQGDRPASPRPSDSVLLSPRLSVQPPLHARPSSPTQRRPPGVHVRAGTGLCPAGGGGSLPGASPWSRHSYSGAHRSPPKLGAKARPPQWPEPVPTRTLMALHEHKSRPHLVNGCGVLGEVAPLPGARERSCEHFPTCLQQGTRKNPERRLGGRPSP